MRHGRLNPFKLTCLALLSAFVAIVAGCGGGGGGGGTPTPTADTTPPTITNTSATSPADFQGGTVTISARVTDTSGVSSVTATVIRPDTTTAQVTMSGSTDYSGTFTAPVNNTTNNAVYRAIISATDTAGNSGSAPEIQFTVPALDAPPPPPPAP